MTNSPKASQRRRIDATVVIHLEDVGDRHEARYRLADLDLIPSHAKVIVSIGECQPGYEATYLLRMHRTRLHYTVHGCEPRRISEWLDAIGGDDDWGWSW